MDRISPQTIERVPKIVSRPEYERAQRKVGIVHLGIGAFHRAHQALYTDEVLALDGGDWMISGVSLRSPEVKRSLQPQSGLYSITEEDGVNQTVRIVGSVKEVLYIAEDRELVLKRLSSPNVKIVSLTVTEKGYCQTPGKLVLDLEHEDIAHDLSDIDTPRSAIGLIVQGLQQRRILQLPAFTVLSCDNLPSNGDTLRASVLQFATRIDPVLSDWIASEVSFPNTMVDRIVPATTPDKRAAISQFLSYVDEAPVCTEPFSQWVIEDKFTGGRPNWEKVGVTLTDDVASFENMKLRLLNGAHSAMAYLGLLSGLETVDKCIEDPALGSYIDRLMRTELMPTVKSPEGCDAAAYVDALLRRFRNPALHHSCAQISMDGSQKLPARLFGPLAERLEREEGIDHLLIAVAGWLSFAFGKGGKLKADPMSEMINAVASKNAKYPKGFLNSMIDDSGIFPVELKQNTKFRRRLEEIFFRLQTKGVEATLATARA